MPAKEPSADHPRTSSRRGRPSANESSLLGARLLDAAQRVFVDAGYAGATMEAIADAAGVSRKSLYARYRNKADVLGAVVKRIVEAPLAGRTRAGPAATRGIAPRAELLQLAHELVASASAPEIIGLERLILAEAAQVPQLAQMYANLSERTLATAIRSLERLQATGNLAGDIDLHVAATVFIEMTVSAPRRLAMMGRRMRRKELDAMLATAVEVFLDGSRRSRP